jgi:DNA-binding MarR family transcriptional regulator
VAKIAQDIGHARQSIQRIADVLASEGLVSYQDHPTDRRTRFVKLTTEGSSVLAEIYRRQVEWSLRIMEQLSPKQLVQLTNGLEGIARVLQSSPDTG